MTNSMNPLTPHHACQPPTNHLAPKHQSSKAPKRHPPLSSAPKLNYKATSTSVRDASCTQAHKLSLMAAISWSVTTLSSKSKYEFGTSPGKIEKATSSNKKWKLEAIIFSRLAPKYTAQISAILMNSVSSAKYQQAPRLGTAALWVLCWRCPLELECRTAVFTSKMATYAKICSQEKKLAKKILRRCHKHSQRSSPSSIATGIWALMVKKSPKRKQSNLQVQGRLSFSLKEHLQVRGRP